jgi:hypothetical protein
MPGLFWVFRPRTRMGKEGKIRRILGLFFPLYSLGYGLYALKHSKNGNVQKRLTLICACEAFFEGFPSLLLQCHTYVHQETQIGTISILAAIGSIIVLAKGIVEFDIICSDVQLSSIKDWAVYCLNLLPLYAVGTFFRIFAMSLTLIYLRWWAILPMILLLGLLVILVGVCIEWDLDIIYSMALSNVCVANVGMVRMTHLYYEDDENEKKRHNLPKDIEIRCKRFLILSQYVTFVHHTVVLGVVLYIIYSNQIGILLPQHVIDELTDLFRPTGVGNFASKVYIPFSIVFLIGILDAITTSCCSHNIKFGNDSEADKVELALGKRKSNNYAKEYLKIIKK